MKIGMDGNDPEVAVDAGDGADVADDVAEFTFGEADEDDACKSIGINGGGESNSSLSF